MPVVGSQSGSHVVSGRTAQPRMSDCTMPIATPAAVVMANDSSPPSSAAASAGITSSGVVVALMPAIGSIRITAMPAMTEATAQLTAPSRSGEMPSSSAPFSLPAAARVARPNRVNRNTAPRTAAATTASSSSRSRFCVTVVPRRSIGSSARTGRWRVATAPLTGNRSRTISCRYSSRPSDATTRARGAAWRSGRKTSR